MFLRASFPKSNKTLISVNCLFSAMNDVSFPDFRRTLIDSVAIRNLNFKYLLRKHMVHDDKSTGMEATNLFCIKNFGRRLVLGCIFGFYQLPAIFTVFYWFVSYYELCKIFLFIWDFHVLDLLQKIAAYICLNKNHHNLKRIVSVVMGLLFQLRVGKSKIFQQSCHIVKHKRLVHNKYNVSCKIANSEKKQKSIN